MSAEPLVASSFTQYRLVGIALPAADATFADAKSWYPQDLIDEILELSVKAVEEALMESAPGN